MRVPEWLSRRAYLSPERLALIAGDLRWSFAELDRRADRTAATLTALGVAPGDRVALLLRNSPAFVELVFGILRLGAVLVPLNTRLTPPELLWQLEDAGARLLAFDEPNREKALAVLQQLPGLPVLDLSGVSEGAGIERVGVERAGFEGDGGAGSGDSGSAEPVPAGARDAGPAGARLLDLDQTQAIVYTSGTTGRPKGALLTYGNHWWSAMGSALNLGLVPSDRWLACLPLFHVGGLSILLRAVIYGIGVVLQPGFDPAAANAAIDREGVTLVSVVSAMLSRMLEERGETPYPPTLRCVLLGGGPAPRPLLEACARRGVPVVQTYGLTEAATQVATLPPEEALRKLGSAGKPLFPTELMILRADGSPAPPGEVGEIAVRGPTVSPGYLGRSEETARAHRDGWLHTGDLGYLDGEGFLYVVDRREDLIVSGGENVYPAEVESVLLEHPDVVEAAVVGVPDARWGRVPAAAVRLRPGARLEAEQLRAFCRERLAGYKVPVRVLQVESLPRNAAGKLLRSRVAELFAAP